MFLLDNICCNQGYLSLVIGPVGRGTCYVRYTGRVQRLCDLLFNDNPV